MGPEAPSDVGWHREAPRPVPAHTFRCSAFAAFLPGRPAWGCFRCERGIGTLHVVPGESGLSVRGKVTAGCGNESTHSPVATSCAPTFISRSAWRTVFEPASKLALPEARSHEEAWLSWPRLFGAGELA